MALTRVSRSGGTKRSSVEIDRQCQGEPDADRHEAVAPADFLAQKSANERTQDSADIDADIEDREGAVVARIAGDVEISPTWVEMFGLNKALPRMMIGKDRKKSGS